MTSLVVVGTMGWSRLRRRGFTTCAVNMSGLKWVALTHPLENGPQKVRETTGNNGN